MDHFHHRDGRLLCEEIPLSALADAVGTPAFVYSLRTVREHIRRMREAFAPLDPLICYAVKANANLAVLDAIRREDTGFDIVSVGELHRLRTVGADLSRVVFSGVGKLESEMEEAIRAGVLMFNVESEEELEVLAGVAERVGMRAGVAIRVNPDVDPRTHRYISTGKKETKFGVDLERAEALARRALALPSIELRGIQCHIGSQITSVAPYAAAVGRTVDLAVRLQADAPRLAYLNMGGGYGIYYADADVPDLADYARAVAPLLAGTDLRLLLEPGRVIVGNAGVLLTRVLFNKVSGDKRFVIVDAGMNDLIRPSLYGGFHRIWPVTGAAPPALGETPDLPLCDVVGPVCETGDFLARERPLPAVARGDLLAVMSVGAYAMVMASNYNERPRPPEVVVDGDLYGVARRRESYADLTRLEEVHPAMQTVGQEVTP
ncbi:MAG: diaminopimelate decarboxylase [Planctomycetota bacterium]|jgi:diaminopimelate decarboxylase